MPTDSGTYTPETIARRLKMAEALLGDAPPVQHWAQGLNELLKGYTGGQMFRKAEDAERTGQAGQYAAIAALLGGGGGAAEAPPAATAPADTRAITTGPRPAGASPIGTDEPIRPTSVPTQSIQPSPTQGIIPTGGGDVPYEQGGMPTRPPQEQISAAIRSAVPQGGPAASAGGMPPAPAVQPTPAVPTGSPIAPPSVGPAAAPAEAGGGDMKAKIAAMLRDPNPYVRRQGGQLATQAVAGMLKAEGTEDIKNFEYAKRGGFPGTFTDYLHQKKSDTTGKYGLQPIWGFNEKGDPVIMQLSGTGEAAATKLPAGVTPSSRNLVKVDTGTTIDLIDPVTRQVVRSTPKDIEGKESAEERGKAAGLAQVDLPRVVGNAEQALQTIKQIREHPGKDIAIGSLGWVPGIPGTQQKDFVSLVDQAKGKAFLEAFNSLKGGGQITEIEGKKATDAIARLDRTQTKDGFNTALKDLEDVIKQGVARARQKAGIKETTTTSGADPAAELRKKYGLE